MYQMPAGAVNAGFAGSTVGSYALWETGYGMLAVIVAALTLLFAYLALRKTVAVS